MEFAPVNFRHNNETELVKQVVKEMGSDDALTYADYVERGRTLLKRIEVYQVQIAMYACKVCQIRHGGISDDFYTLTDYARDLGIPAKTLQSWTSVFRNVLVKLDIPMEEVTKKHWQVASRVNDNLRYQNRRDNMDNGTNRRSMKYKTEISDEKVQELFELESKGPSLETDIRNWLCSLRARKNNIIKKDLSLANRGDLMEIMNLLDEMSDQINDYLTSSKNKKH